MLPVKRRVPDIFVLGKERRFLFFVASQRQWIVIACFFVSIVSPVCPVLAQGIPTTSAATNESNTNSLLFQLIGSISREFSASTIPALAANGPCGYYTSGNGLAKVFETRLGIPWGNVMLSPLVRWEDLSNTSETTPANQEDIYNPATKSIERASRVRSYAATLRALSIGGTVSIPVIGKFQLGIGGNAGFYTQHHYLEQEKITAPDGAYYLENNLSSKQIGNGQIEVNPRLALLGEASYPFELKNGIEVRPMIQASLPLMRVASDPSLQWRVTSLSAGLAFGYRIALPQKREEALSPPLAIKQEPVAPAIQAPKQDAIPPQKRSVLSLQVRAVGIDRDGNEITEPVLRVEQMKVTEAFPTLSYVFFGSGESAISSRYKQSTEAEVSSFQESSLFYANAFEIHHHLLDIIGSRLRRKPAAKIILTGTRSERDVRDSLSTSSLSMDRAKAVAKYLTDHWHIAPDRITLKSRNLPELPSEEATTSGRSENRRVEIVSNDPTITAPLWAHRIEHVATPPQIDFIPTIVSSAGVRSATITVTQGGKELQRFDALSSGSTGEHLWSLDESSMPTGTDSLKYAVEVIDSVGERAYAEGYIRLRSERKESAMHAQDTIGTHTIERFSLILFDYSSSQFNRKQTEGVIADIIRVADPESYITLSGHTDQTGNDEFNEKLSADRASSAYSLLLAMLKQQHKPVPAVNVEAHGSRDILFDNSVPEGRFLSRTVRITVEHPEKAF